MTLTRTEQQERLVSGLVYNLWGTDPDKPWATLPEALAADEAWETFQSALISMAGSDDETTLARLLVELDQYLGDELYWLAGEEPNKEPPESPAAWLSQKLVELCRS